MLQGLFIKNYALIDELDIQFSKNLNIITGETGAGKSIMLGALSLILGHRANTAALQNNTEKCIIEGTFAVGDYNLKHFFEQAELDYDEQTIIRREINRSGKSRAFINDTPVHLTLLKQLGEKLVSLHAQHQTLHLHDTQYHLFIVDTLANHSDILLQYGNDFKQYQRNIRLLNKQEKAYAKLQKDLDYIKFQLNEFDEAALHDPDEQEQLEQELSQLNNADDIRMSLMQSLNLIDDEDDCIVQQVNLLKSTLSGISQYNSDFEALYQRVESLMIELQDVSQELNMLEGDIVVDPERLSEVEERLNLIFRLQKKHGVQTVAELISIADELADQNLSVDHLADSIEKLKHTIKTQRQALFILAQQISDNRKVQLPVFETKINDLLSQVGMPNATIKAKHIVSDQLDVNGLDAIEVLFAANKGSSHNELRKVASGGELSRLMLCIQSLMADNMALPTLIFDEIDTGISGEVALKVGKVMQKLAKSHQLICITHLPQIASKGSKHYFVYKQDTAERTISKVRLLQNEDRVTEIAKMLSGDDPGQMALANAAELLRG